MAPLPAPLLRDALDSEQDRTHFERDEELARWITERGMSHVRGLGADVLAAYCEPPNRAALEYALGRHRFTDYATTQSLRRYGYLLTYAPRMQAQLPVAAWKFLRAECAALTQARAQVENRLVEPGDPRAKPAAALLLGARGRFPRDLPPRLDETLVSAKLRYSATLPGFVYEHDRRALVMDAPTSPLILPTVEVKLSAGEASAWCSCSALHCEHALAAVDALLLKLREPLPSELAQTLEELSRAPWERALKAMERALEEQAAAANAVLVSWRLRIREEDGVEVTPYVHKRGKKGGASAGTRIGPSRLLELFRSQLADDDARIAELATQTFGRARRPLLSALVGHARVFLEEDPERALRVECVDVGLVAEERNGTVVLGAGIEGALLTAELAHAARTAKADEALHLWDPGARVLTVLRVSDETRAMLGVLDQFGNEFPPESHAALLERLSHASSRLPVALPRSVMGERVSPALEPMIRMQVQSDASVRLEIRVRPLPELSSFVPGEGPKSLHARRGQKAIHARRDFPLEKERADALAGVLPLQNAEHEEGHCYVLPSPQHALEVLSACPKLEPRPAIEWVGEPMRLSSPAVATSLKVILEKKREWFGLLGDLSVDGERVELAVLLDAARRRERFIRTTVHERTYIELEQALREHLERLADHTYRSKHGVEIRPSGAEALDALATAGANLNADETWRALAAKIFAAKALTPRVPRSLKATLRDYQLEGFQWLTRLASWDAGAVLADDMGLGKTVQALAVLLNRASKGPALVLAPTSVGFNWMEEAARFAPSLKLQMYADSEDRGRTLSRLGAKDVLVVSYGLLVRDLERLTKVRFSTIVFDEAQALKNAATQRARAARELQGDFRFALSGTPLENHLGELWSLYRLVFPGLLGSWDAFRDRFATPIEKKIDPTAAPALARVLKPFLLRRTKDQVERELPPRTEVKVPIVLSGEEWQLYEDARLSALSDLETSKAKMKEQERRIEVLAALTRLRLLASHPRLCDAASTVESSKLRRLLELVEELTAEGHQALIFSQFTSHLALVREVLDARGLGYLYLDGSTARKERERRVHAFQEGAAPLFLISLKAGGFGLNLTAADFVIHLDPWWNPAVEDQASDRAHRIGQTRPVTVYRLVARGTIEEQILALHADKRALVTGVLDGKDSAGRMTAQELIALLGDAGTVAPPERKNATVH
ncbi:MAG: DEAD/DEAH box helicase [Myxococcaceae bacterium]